MKPPCPRPHRWPEGPNEDMGVCRCGLLTYVLRPDGETYGDHLPDCSLPRRHESYCQPGGAGHPSAPTIRGYWPELPTPKGSAVTRENDQTDGTPPRAGKNDLEAGEGAPMPEITVEPTTYTVSAVPEDVPQAYLWAITVEKRGRGRWAVCRMKECLGADGEWDWEVSTSSRTDEWLESHRFDLATALNLAQREAPEVIVNGITVADALTRWASRAATS